MRLSKDLTAVAASALQKNMVMLGPLVLPFSEKFLFAINLIRRKLLGNKKLKPYTPDFSLAFEHICIHSGKCKCTILFLYMFRGSSDSLGGGGHCGYECCGGGGDGSTSQVAQASVCEHVVSVLLQVGEGTCLWPCLHCLCAF